MRSRVEWWELDGVVYLKHQHSDRQLPKTRRNESTAEWREDSRSIELLKLIFSNHY